MKEIYLDHRVGQAWGVDKKLLTDADNLLQTTIQIAKQLKLTIVNSYIHKFKPHGLSLVLIIAQSHLAVHTWPEFSYIHIDVVSCSKQADLTQLQKILKLILQPNKLKVSRIRY